MEDAAPHANEEPAADAAPAPAPAPTAGAGYRIALDSYSGPLDLLLYLIRKEEVDLYDIPIARIAEQYQRTIELMAEINVNLAGEFIVMAATLMEIKSRMLLPTEEGMGDDEEEDPRAELVRQLLEYKRYKDLARELGARAAEQARKFPLPGKDLRATTDTESEAADDAVPSLEGVGLWELIDAFAKVLSETRLGAPQTRVLERVRAIHEFRRELLRIITSEEQVVFSRVFAGCSTRDEMIGMFIALLELVRLRRLVLQQAGVFGEIYVCAAGAEAPVRSAPEAEPSEPAAAEPKLPGGGEARPVALKAADVLQEIDAAEEEAESLGRARGRIDAAIERVQAFLKEHHEQMQQQQGDTEPTADGEDGSVLAPPLAQDAAGADRNQAEGEPRDAQEGPVLDQRQQP